MPEKFRDDTQHYFYPVYHSFLDRHLAEMKGSTLKVFMAIARHVKFSSGFGPISISKVEATAGCCHNSVVEALAELEAIGVLSREMSPGMCTIYVLNQNSNSPQKMGGVEEVTSPQKMGGESPQKMGGTPPKNQTLIEKREEREDIIGESSSPHAGEASFHTNFDFSDFVRGYADLAGDRPLKTKNQVSAARDEWNKLPAEDRQRVYASSSAWEASGKWSGEQGKYRPNMAKFISEGYWQSMPKNHRKECEAIREVFLRVTGISTGLCEMSQRRFSMLSARYEEALKKAIGNTHGNAMEVIEAAIEARFDAHEKNGRGRLTLESVFETTETFERWLGAAVEAQ